MLTKHDKVKHKKIKNKKQKTKIGSKIATSTNSCIHLYLRETFNLRNTVFVC